MKSGRSDRVVVHLEGTPAFDLAVEVIERTGLRRGDHLDLDEQDRLLDADAPYRARDKAMAWLAVRERCRREIQGRLRDSGFPEEVVADTIRWLEDRGYLNDRRFATVYTRDRLRGGWGERRIRADLVRRGVDREAIDEVLGSEGAEAGTACEGLATVAELARRRFGGQLATDPVAARRRLSGFLARRGYDWDTIAQITRGLCEEAGAGEADGDCDPDMDRT